MDTYIALAKFAQTWGLVGFVVLFTAVLVYALKPSNKARFEAAARMPLEKD